MAVVIVLALLLSACGGGGTGLIQPQQINAPNDVEREHDCDSQLGTLQKSYPAGAQGRRSFRQFLGLYTLHHS